MPTSVATLPIGTDRPPNTHTSLGVQVYYHYVYEMEFYYGTTVLSTQLWNIPQEVYVQQNNEWKKVESSYVMTEGEWKPSGTLLQRLKTTRTTRVRIWSRNRDSNAGGAFSIYEFTLPDELYIPSGWTMPQFSARGIYDDNMDAIFFGTDSQFPLRRALVLARRSTPSYAFSNTSAWSQWSAITGIVTDVPQGGRWNRLCGHIRTPNYSSGQYACGADGDSYYDRILTTPSSYLIPFNFNQWVSIKQGSNCSTCNHGAELKEAIFEDPSSAVITYS
jgi:hypothetical protein